MFIIAPTTIRQTAIYSIKLLIFFYRFARLNNIHNYVILYMKQNTILYLYYSMHMLFLRFYLLSNLIYYLRFFGSESYIAQHKSLRVMVQITNSSLYPNEIISAGIKSRTMHGTSIIG